MSAKPASLLLCCLGLLWVGLALAPAQADEVSALQAGLDGRQVGYELYRVQAGDTVENIAVRFGVSPEGLRALNRIPPEARVAPGQSLAVLLPGKPRPRPEEPPTLAPAPTPAAPEDTAYTPRYAVVARACSITSARPPSPGRLLWQCDPGDRVVVTAEQNGYLGVIMLGGSTGWLPRDSAQLTDQVLSPEELNRLLQASTQGRRGVVQEAMRYLGTPYRYGGRLPDNVDCSLLVQTAFARHGLSLPRTAAEQCEVGQPVVTADLQAGDRLYFINRAGRINHTAIYIGDNQFIHASSNRGCVAIDSLSNPYYAARFYAARRS